MNNRQFKLLDSQVCPIYYTFGRNRNRGLYISKKKAMKHFIQVFLMNINSESDLIELINHEVLHFVFTKYWNNTDEFHFSLDEEHFAIENINYFLSEWL